MKTDIELITEAVEDALLEPLEGIADAVKSLAEKIFDLEAENTSLNDEIAQMGREYDELRTKYETLLVATHHGSLSSGG